MDTIRWKFWGNDWGNEKRKINVYKANKITL